MEKKNVLSLMIPLALYQTGSTIDLKTKSSWLSRLNRLFQLTNRFHQWKGVFSVLKGSGWRVAGNGAASDGIYFSMHWWKFCLEPAILNEDMTAILNDAVSPTCHSQPAYVERIQVLDVCWIIWQWPPPAICHLEPVYMEMYPKAGTPFVLQNFLLHFYLPDIS